MICSWYFASAFCFIQQCFPPIVTVAPPPIAYDQRATATAYTLSVDETDDTPCIGAGNNNLCKLRPILREKGQMICASRDLPLDTIIYIEGFGECVILDRMNIRYKGTGRVDILMDTYKEAITFGKRELNYVIIK